jgi:HAMP domain-containing protein
VLSIGALVMAVLLFQQRETLKGRTQKLENAVHQIAATVEKGETPGEMVAIPENQLKTFKSKPGGPPTMDGPLNELVTAAQGQLVHLNNTRKELADTKDTLAKTEEDLKNTKTELASAQAKIKEQETTIEAQKTTISEKESAIAKLESEKAILIAQNEAMRNNIEEMEAGNNALMDEIAELDEKFFIYEARLYPELHKKAFPKGYQGVVANVNPDWNFLVLRLVPESAKLATPNLEFLVYRGDKLVGKVRLSKVIDDLAVAEVINDWEQVPPQNGDGILY